MTGRAGQHRGDATRADWWFTSLGGPAQERHTTTGLIVRQQKQLGARKDTDKAAIPGADSVTSDNFTAGYE
jgi:hypothetical protein